MPAELSPEKKSEIIETWEEMYDEKGERPTYSEVADEVDVHSGTVKKYVKELSDGDEELPEDFDTIPSLGNGSEDNEPLFPDPAQQLSDDFAEFFIKLNEQYSLGIQERAINMMAGEIRNTGQLPSPMQVASFLESANSGLANAQDIQWVVRQYSLWTQRYQTTGGTGQQGMMGDSGGGAMFGQPADGVFGQGPNASPGGVGAGGQPMMGVSGQQGGGNQGTNPMMMQMFQQMNQQLQALQQQIQKGGGDEGGDMLEEKTKEFLESRLEQLIDADTDSERNQVVQEIQALRRQIDSDGGQPTPDLGEDWRKTLLALTQSGKLEPGDAKDLLAEMGETETNPEVMEKKFERDIKEMEMERRSEQIERLGDMLDNVTDRFAESFAQSLASGGADTSSGADEAAADGGEATSTPASGQHTSPSANGSQAPSQTEKHECKHCGADMEVEPTGAVCPNCEYGVGGCDNCGIPVEIPPRGEARYAGCPDCGGLMERGATPDETVECDECEWAGESAALEGEGLQCDGCGELRPIMRTEDVLARQQEVTELLEGDPGDLMAQSSGSEEIDMEDKPQTGD